MKINRFIWQYIFALFFAVWVCISSNAYDEFVANILRGVGLILLIIGVIGRIYATIFIGGMKNEGVDGTKFIDYGAYSLCRNPLYLFSFIAFIGLLLLKAQLSLLFVGVVFYLLIYHFTILQEEAFLKGKFGKDFEEFLHHTSRFFPKFSNFHCPEKIQVRPKFLHIEFKRSVNWFLGALALVIVELLHHYEILPNFIFAY